MPLKTLDATQASTTAGMGLYMSLKTGSPWNGFDATSMPIFLQALLQYMHFHPPMYA